MLLAKEHDLNPIGLSFHVGSQQLSKKPGSVLYSSSKYTKSLMKNILD